MSIDAEAQLARIHALLQLLQQEAVQLRACDAATLKALCFDKLAHLRHLDALLAALKTPGANIGTDQRRKLLELLRQCQQLTERNEALLHSRMNRGRAALQARRGAPAHYDAHGGGSYETQRRLRSIA
jgi:flagellar biosynthesis/type III secretory pathway chaperone